MVHLSRKRIKGKDYLYAVRSVRLPDGKILKLSKLIGEKKEAASLKEFFDQKQARAIGRYYEKLPNKLNLHDSDALEKMERIRLEYREILRRLTPSQLNDLFDRFTVNFTYESNALEGNSLTLRQVAIVIHENSSIQGKNLREVYETRNSRQVVDLILKRKFSVAEKDALKMHSLLVKDMGIPEGYKTLPNYLQGRQLTTTPPEHAATAVKQLFGWFGKNKRKMHPLQLAARLHGKFEEIHPFEDGNGRVGRFLILVALANAGYPPLIIRKTQRIAYFNALEEFDNGRPQALEKFLYERLKETHEKFFKIYAKYLK